MKALIKKITPKFVLSIYHFKLALFGALIYGFPSKKIKVIGATGTKGKSSVCELASKILEEKGYKVAMISSIYFKIGDDIKKNDLKMTMPGRMKIQRFFKKANKAKCDYAILEVTSEGILQHRHRFIDFDAVVLNNLSPEHIDHHGSFENYRAAKGKLFKACKKTHIINNDDENREYFLQFKADKKIKFSINNDSDIKAEIVHEASFDLKGIPFNLNLIGRFNAYNALCAISVAKSQGIDLNTCKTALEKVKGIEGRLEFVQEHPFKIVVDYAHTADSLEKVYKTLQGSKICVLGSCGGGRDKWRRPKLGKIASKYCNKIIITNEDPYDEDPMAIINQIAERAPQAEKILDRRQAISKAIKIANPNDIVIITGKGSEIWMCVEKGKKIPWSDAQIAREELEKMKKGD